MLEREAALSSTGAWLYFFFFPPLVKKTPGIQVLWSLAVFFEIAFFGILETKVVFSNTNNIAIF